MGTHDVGTFGGRAYGCYAVAQDKAGGRSDCDYLRRCIRCIPSRGEFMKQCPLCGSPHDTIDGVIMHMRNSKDEVHAHIHNQLQAAEHIQNAENGDSGVSSNTKFEDTGGVSESTQKQNTEGVPPSSMFDEPDSGTELSDFEGEPVGDMVALPCGHEEVHPSDIPPDATVIVCEVCGRKYGVSDV